ncbi:response regulator [Sphingomonas sp. PB4P5]|uniref:response regulator n=1 Tax=Parasphingomonas puruogangriensis TaxID=3096155 RepID=UPI002FC6216B
MRHVLIIEDMYLFQQYLKDIATLAGASSISVVSTQDDAVESARQQKPALILSDIKLPQGSGVSAIDTIMADHGDIPVIFITGYPERCDNHSSDGVLLTKPVSADVLLKTVSAFFGGAPLPTRH